jgi:tetratricopeptide (TPR) repeat protein
MFQGEGIRMTAPYMQPDLHQRAKELYQLGQLPEAAQLFSDAIAQNPTGELWNDWAAVQTSLGHLADAERGFRVALRLDGGFALAAENLGALLFAQGRFAEAAPLLRQSLDHAPEENRSTIEKMLSRCNTALVPEDGTPSQAPATVDTEIVNASQAAAVLAAPPDEKLSYEEWFASVFRQRVPAPTVRIATSWQEDSHWGRKAFLALLQVEYDYVTQLLTEIRDAGVLGDIAEFGIFEGGWINVLWQATEQLSMARRIYGFDSFAGLSEPHPERDQAFWKKGQYACSFEQVAQNVQLAGRPRIKLVKGFFENSLRGADAQVAEKFAYARIDCDIYEPALDCLRYLAPRLADGAILVFDDWPHLRGFGEQRAFEEWLPTVPHLEFEFLFYGVIGHFYIRVHHRK